MKQVEISDMSKWDVETIIFALDQLKQQWEKADRKDDIESPGVEHLKKLLSKLGMVRF